MLTLYDREGLEAVKERPAQDLRWVDGWLERFGYWPLTPATKQAEQKAEGRRHHQ